MKRLTFFLLLLSSLAALADVTTQNYSVTYFCTGSSAPYTFTFPISSAAALTVTQDGTPTSAYTVVPVNNNYENGGKVTLNVACPNGSTLVLARVTPLTQATVFTDNMPTPMKTFERSLDKLTEITQEQAGDIGAVANWGCPVGYAATGLGNFIPQCIQVLPAGTVTALIATNNIFTGANNFKVISAVRTADTFTGSTVTAKLDAAIADCGTNQCVVQIPSSMGAGAPTSVPKNVTLMDFRRTVTLIGNASGAEANVLYEANNSTGTTNRVFGTAFQAHATAGGTGIVGEGETVAAFAAAERTGGTRSVWAINSVTSCAVTGNGCFGYELDFNAGYDSSITTNASDQQLGIKIVSGAAKHPLVAIQTSASTPATGAWLIGADIQNWSTFGVRIGAPYATGNPNLYLVPQANDSNNIFVTRNAADNVNIFQLQNSGNVITPGLIQAAFFRGGAANEASTGELRLATTGSVMFRNNANGADVNGISKNSSDVVAVGGAAGIIVGTGGTALARYARYSKALTPASVAANTCAAEAVSSVTGVTSSDILIGISKPTEQAGLSVTPGHVSGTGALTLNFCNNTGSPIVPTASETYQFVVVQ